ncbi:MAG: hypothetical protein PWQ79_714 [Thermococcaceae archaeon]|nr:hypothetical protein [Thermococcaceae archaeon]
MRRAQAAVEYLFMVSLALIMVLITIKLVHQTASKVELHVNRTSREILEVLRNMSSSSG